MEGGDTMEGEERRSGTELVGGEEVKVKGGGAGGTYMRHRIRN